MGHMTCDRWQVTCDMWYMVGGENFLKISSFTVWDRQCLEDWEEKDILYTLWCPVLYFVCSAFFYRVINFVDLPFIIHPSKTVLPHISNCYKSHCRINSYNFPRNFYKALNHTWRNMTITNNYENPASMVNLFVQHYGIFFRKMYNKRPINLCY